MKLLFCNKCADIITLQLNELRYCKCKECSAQYVDNLNAIFTGDGIMIGFSNITFVQAIRNPGIDFTAFTIAEPCKTFKRV